MLTRPESGIWPQDKPDPVRLESRTLRKRKSAQGSATRTALTELNRAGERLMKKAVERSVTTWPPRILLVGGLAVTLLIAACTGLRNLEPPEVVVTAIRPIDATLLEQRFEVDLRIYNPNNRELDIDGVDFELVVNGNRLARGSGATELLLPRLGEAVTTVRVSTTLFGVARQAMSAGQGEPVSYRLSGRIHLGSGLGGSLPFERSGVLGAAH